MVYDRLSLTVVLFVIFVQICSASSSKQNLKDKTTSTNEPPEKDNSRESFETSERGRNHTRRSDISYRSIDKHQRASDLPHRSHRPPFIPPRLQQSSRTQRSYNYPSDVPPRSLNPIPPRFQSGASANSPGLSESGRTLDARFQRSSRIHSYSSCNASASQLNPGATVFVPTPQLGRASISPAFGSTSRSHSTNAKKSSKASEIVGFPFEGFSESGNVAIGHDAREIADDLPTNIFIAWKTNVKTYVIPPSTSFDETANDIKNIVRDSVVVGYGVRKLFKKLNISHPNFAIRDLECLTKFCDFVIDRSGTIFQDFFHFFYRKMTTKKDVEAVANKSYRVYSRFRLEWEEEIDKLIKLQAGENRIRHPMGHAGFHCDDEYYPLDALYVEKKTIAISIHCMKDETNVKNLDMVDSSGNVLTHLRNLDSVTEENKNWKKDLEKMIRKIGAKVIVGFRVKAKLAKILEIDGSIKVMDLSEMFRKHRSITHTSKKILRMDALIGDKQLDGIDRARLALQLYKVLLPNLDRLLKPKSTK